MVVNKACDKPMINYTSLSSYFDIVGMKSKRFGKLLWFVHPLVIRSQKPQPGFPLTSHVWSDLHPYEQMVYSTTELLFAPYSQ